MKPTIPTPATRPRYLIQARTVSGRVVLLDCRDTGPGSDVFPVYQQDGHATGEILHRAVVEAMG